MDSHFKGVYCIFILLLNCVCRCSGFSAYCRNDVTYNNDVNAISTAESFAYYSSPGTLEEGGNSVVFFPSQCPLGTVCARRTECSGGTQWQCIGKPVVLGQPFDTNFSVWLFDLCDGDTISVYERPTLPYNGTSLAPAAVRSCTLDKDCAFALSNGSTIAADAECVGGKCSETQLSTRMNRAFLNGNCGRRGLRSYATLEYGGDSSGTMWTYRCRDTEEARYTYDDTTPTPTVPGPLYYRNASDRIADACSLCAHTLARNSRLSGYVNASDGDTCLVTRPQYVVSDGYNISCRAYFSDNIFIAREGQLEYESLGGETPDYLVVGHIPSDLRLPWRSFAISPPWQRAAYPRVRVSTNITDRGGCPGYYFGPSGPSDANPAVVITCSYNQANIDCLSAGKTFFLVLPEDTGDGGIPNNIFCITCQTRRVPKHQQHMCFFNV